MIRGIRKKDHENLSETKIDEVINLLRQDKPITKKEACEILNITYNTARLSKIIEDHEDRKQSILKRKQELKNKPITTEETIFFISSYLENGNLSAIADESYRSTHVIKRVLEKYNVPLRKAATNYFNPPEVSKTSEEYNKDDLVYSARYDQAALISKKLMDDPVHGAIYRIWLAKDCQYALQPFYELADLREVQKLGVNVITRKWIGDLQQDVVQAIVNAKKGKKDAD